MEQNNCVCFHIRYRNLLNLMGFWVYSIWIMERIKKICFAFWQLFQFIKHFLTHSSVETWLLYKTVCFLPGFQLFSNGVTRRKITLSFVLFWGSVSLCNPGWPRIHYVEFMTVLLPVPSFCWDYKSTLCLKILITENLGLKIIQPFVFS